MGVPDFSKDRADNSFEREDDDTRMAATLVDLIEDMASWMLVAGMSDWDDPHEDPEVLDWSDRIYDRLRNRTTRQDLLVFVVTAMMDQAAERSRLLETGVKRVRNDSDKTWGIL